MKSFFQRHSLQHMGSAWFSNQKFLFTPTVKIPRNSHFNDLSNEYKIISVPRRIFSEKKGFLMVNVRNSKTRTLQNKDPALQNIQHMVWRWWYLFRPSCEVAKSVSLLWCKVPWHHKLRCKVQRPIKLDSRPHYDYVLKTQ